MARRDMGIATTPTGRGATLLALVLVVVAAGSACTSSAERPSSASASGSTGSPQVRDPRSVAEAFAAGVARGDLTGVPLTSATAATAGSALRSLLAGMGRTRPTVDATDVPAPEADTDEVRAQLHYAWKVGSGTWEYDATLPLVRDGDAWAASWTATAVHPQLGRGDRLTLSTIPAPRGPITGRGGAVIVADRPVTRVGIDKTLLKAGQAATSAARVAAAVGVDVGAYQKAVAGAGPAAFVEAIVYRAGDPVGRRAIASLRGVPGVSLVDATRPLAPTRTFARPVLGTVVEASAEVISKAAGAIAFGDLVGSGGLQQSQDARLRGTSGARVDIVGGSGGPRPLFSSAPVAGQAVSTTLDVRLQTKAEALLASLQPASAIVAIQPSTGDVLAAASGPGGQGYSTATLGQYAPGSTFKVVTALALLRAGLTPQSIVSCPATTSVEGRQFKNYDAYPTSRLGSVPLRVAFANSCNTAMITAGAAVEQSELVAAAASLGLGVDPALGVPAYLGGLPATATGVEHAADTIGQGRVQASPLGMAVVAASVAAGHTVVPRLLVSPSPPTPTAAASAPLAANEADGLRTLMRAVVTEGSGTILRRLPGDVLAKTGTAEFGPGDPPRTHAWMLGVAGDLAVCVFVDVGAGGARTAGPILAAFLS